MSFNMRKIFKLIFNIFSLQITKVLFDILKSNKVWQPSST